MRRTFRSPGRDEVTRNIVTGHLASLSGLGYSGVSRARKLVAIRELFGSLTREGALEASPAVPR